MNGLCECGCGGKTKVSKKSHFPRGYIKGVPRRFINGHQSGYGEKNQNWRGGKRITTAGYIFIRCQGHPCVDKNNELPEHILIAMKVFGKPLPEGVVIHHVNGTGSDNRNGNLVICQDTGYHHLLHNRTNAIKCGYPPTYRKCHFCKRHDSLDNMYPHECGYHHADCQKNYDKKRYDRREIDDRP